MTIGARASGLRSEVKHEVVELSPADAEELLKRNTHNRKISEDDVIKWAHEMEQGRWQYNGEAIKIADDGTILDGQHRLTALTLCIGVKIQVLLITGLPRETQKTMDQGRKRSAQAQLSLDGFTANAATAAAIKQFILWDEGRLFCAVAEKNARTTTPKVVDWVEANRDVAELIHEAGSKFRHVPTKSSMVQTAYAAVAVSTSVPLETVDEFFTGLSEGAGLEPNSPILVLRNRLTRIAAESQRVSARDMLGYVILAYNHWRRSNGLTKLQRPAAGWNEDTFPEVYPK